MLFFVLPPLHPSQRTVPDRQACLDWPSQLISMHDCRAARPAEKGRGCAQIHCFPDKKAERARRNLSDMSLKPGRQFCD